MRQVEFQLKTEASLLQGWTLLPADYFSLPLVVLCHGIPSGQPVEGDPGYEGLARELARHGYISLFFNFRGAGFSRGDFSLRGWADDLQAVLDLAFGGQGVFAAVDPGRVALWGYSGGGAAAILQAARDHRVAAVVSLAAPDGLDRIFPRETLGEFIRHCRTVGLIRTEGYPPDEEGFYRELMACRPVDFVARISPTPLLIVHGTADETVPASSAVSLYEAAKEPRDLVLIERGEHKLRHNGQATAAALDWLGCALRNGTPNSV
jgi:uncharacterized protein